MDRPTSTPPTTPSSAPKRQKQRKVLLMGKSGAGKSSMRSIVFSNYVASDVRRLGATIDIEHSNIRFMGNLTLNLWDCGGQDGFMENYLQRQREHVFGNVAVLIYVFDVESREFAADLQGYRRVVRALDEFTGAGGGGGGSNNSSKDPARDSTAKDKEKDACRVWVLVHKMDLLDSTHRSRIYRERTTAIRAASESFSDGVEFFATSIWDQSLYRAWTRIIYHLIPNAGQLEALLSRLATVVKARECILYERTTCLVVARTTGKGEEGNPAESRFEGISSVLKTHKQSLARHTHLPAASANFTSLQIKTSTFMFFITRLTENTNLAVVLPPSEQAFNAARTNVALARPRFMELDVAARARGHGSGGGAGFMESAARDVGVEAGGREGGGVG